MPDLTARFRRQIEAHGPMPVAQYMAAANAAYYDAADPLGAGGDFVTAPEISQMFGELVGLALTDRWRRAGSPEPVAYVELGPGRGTLAADALRAMAGFGLRPEVHFVEASRALRRLLRERHQAAAFHEDAGSLPDDRPLLLVANEFFDALPVHQLVRTEAGWRERVVALDGDRFVFAAGERRMDAAVPDGDDACAGTIVETAPAASAIMRDLATRIAAQGGAGLVFDYGYAGPRDGSTLQAVSRHRKVDPLEEPGARDLTTHVDFAALADAARGGGAVVDAIATQGDWLRAHGIEERAAALKQAWPDRAAELDDAVRRLTVPEEMGALFKVLSLAGWR